MSEKIEAEIIYTIDDYARALKYIQNRQFLVKYLLPFMFSIFAVVLFFNYLSNPAKFTATFLQPASILIVIIAFTIISLWHFYRKNKPGFLLKRQIAGQFKSSPALREPKIISLDDTGIFGGSNLGESQTKWEAFIEATETKNDFFFFTSNKFAQFIPKRFFSF